MALPLNTTPGPSPDEESGAQHRNRPPPPPPGRRGTGPPGPPPSLGKAWGAAAHAVKAVAEKRRWFNDADWKLAKVVSILAEEQEDMTLQGFYLAAREAHFNFYHHEFNAREVQQALAAAGELIARLEAVLANGAVPVRNSGEALQQEIRNLELPTSTVDRQGLQQGRPPMDRRPPVEPESADIED